MKSESMKFFVLTAVTLFVVTYCIVLQFNAAENAVSIFETRGVVDAGGAAVIEKTVMGLAGVSSVKADRASGLFIVAYDARAADPRSFAAAVRLKGYPANLAEILSMEEYISIASGGSNCGSGGCGNCSKSK